MSFSSPPTNPAMTIVQANGLLLSEPHFEIVERDSSGVLVKEWRFGPKTIADVLALQRNHGDRPFLVYEEQRCTYSSAVNASETIAAMLVSAGLNKGDRVALVMRNRLEWPVCFFGSILAGGVVVPINGWSLPAEMQAMIEDCGARFVFSDRDDFQLPTNVEQNWAPDGEAFKSVIGDPSSWSLLAGPKGRFPAQAPDDLAALFYTSGTTSRPKGATMTHRALTATIMNSEFNAARVRLRFPATSTSNAVAPSQPAALFPVPLFHVTGAIPGLIGSSALGAKIVFMRKWDVGEALRLIEQEHINLLGGVPTMALQLLADPRCKDYDLTSLNGMIYGGAPAPSILPSAIATQFGAEASTGWGMTETASTLLHNSGPEYSLRPMSCGVAVPVNDARIADDAGVELAPGSIGELQVRGLNVTQGYWNRPDENEAAFTVDSWFRTGDIARIDEEGFVTIVDRAKDVIIRGGENIACIEIEDALCAHPDVVEAAIVGREHSTLGEEPAAFLTLVSGAMVTDAELTKFTALKLAKHKIPVQIIRSFEPLPRNAAGKVLKKGLRNQLANWRTGDLDKEGGTSASGPM